MKILFATASINERGGGIASYAIDVIKQYKDEHDFLVISNDELDNKYTELIKNFKRISSRDFSFDNLSTLLEVTKNYSPDIILNSDFELMSLAVPYIDPSVIKLSISHLVNGGLTIIAGFNHHYYDKIISLSYAGITSFKKYFRSIDTNKIEVIYNFYSGEVCKKDEGSDPHTLNIVYPGGASLNKSPLLVYRILKGLLKTSENFKFYWLGNTSYSGSFIFKKRYIADLVDADSRVNFTGNLPRKEALSIIQNADIFLLPSKKEGCPITLLEAMSAGTIPIVSNARHASSEIVRNGQNGFVLSSTNEKEYIMLIEKIIRNPEEYAGIRQNCIEFFRENLNGKTWKLMMDQIFTCGSERGKGQIKLSKYTFYCQKINLQFRLFICKIKNIIRSYYYSFKFHYVYFRKNVD